jgi:hypothetical protein
LFRQVLYTSQATGVVNEEDREQILQTSRNNNMRDAVTGLLISLPNGTFVQTLEGPPAGVTNALNRIRKDPRHVDLTVILDHHIAARDFPEWTMGYRSLGRAELKQLPGFRDMGDKDFTAIFDSGSMTLSIMKAIYNANK